MRTLLKDIAREKDIGLLECEPIVDHVHLLVRAASREELSWFLKLLKGRSSYELFREMPELKMDAGENSLWQRGFAARPVPASQLAIVQRYIRTQDQRLEKYER